MGVAYAEIKLTNKGDLELARNSYMDEDEGKTNVGNCSRCELKKKDEADWC